MSKKCVKCGALIGDTPFCEYCGAAQSDSNDAGGSEREQFRAHAASVEFRQAPLRAEPPVSPTKLMVLGIVAAALVGNVSIAAIIVGAIGLSNCKTYAAAGFPFTGKAKVGHILSKVGLYAGIGFLVVKVVIAIVYVSLFGAWFSQFGAWFSQFLHSLRFFDDTMQILPFIGL